MRGFLLGLWTAVFMAGALFAQGDEIEGVIGSQIEAFKQDDFATAFTFASPNIQGIFRSPENFGRMVSQGYPMVWRPAEVDFLELREDPRGLTQRVQIVDGQGVVHMLDYFMIQTGDGWKINGVELIKQPGVSA